MIKGININLTIGKKKLLHNIDFEIQQGTITAFIGPSGAGKTTLIKCIAHLITHYTGELVCNGISMHSLNSQERALTVGFIFQQYNLFPHLTVLENCSIPLSALQKTSQHSTKAVAMNNLKQLRMEDFASCYPAKLSGGQQQRVAICRALCLKPKILLLDEPTSALDPESTHHIATLLKQLCSTGTTIAIASHDMQLVNNIANTVYVIDNGRISIRRN